MSTADGPSDKNIGCAIYLHIPFCVSKCHYCDFASYAGKSHLLEPYLNALLTEIGSASVQENTRRIGSVYMGGGTPSTISPETAEKIMSAVAKKFNPSASSEKTIEANPESVTPERLAGYIKAGFNRLSIGVQSFNDRNLKSLGRAHDSQRALEAFDMARKAGFKNISVDLIYGIPGQTLSEFAEDISKAVSLAPEHISAYQLTVEEETPLWDMVEKGTVIMPEDTLLLEMFEKTVTSLSKAGYRHYEVSNFAKPGMECKHNLSYWLGEEFLGFGNGAHSFINSSRFANPDEPEDYIYEVDTAGRAGAEILGDEKDRVLEFLLMRLRLVGKKLTFKELDEKFFPFGRHDKHGPRPLFDETYRHPLDWISKNGLAEVNSDGFTLTHKGLLFLDDILLEFEKV
ncbi:MAG: radical SAM family heme chaperone HemW [Nitrospinae bacterium]|nr:radical SAM family heme chaperone HemW [Nitrospinota bacterium]